MIRLHIGMLNIRMKQGKERRFRVCHETDRLG